MIIKRLSILYKLLRVDNWTKNILIFFPCFFGKKFMDLSIIYHLLIAAGIFCLLSSCAYIINDLIDAPLDRNHPDKKKRPIAANEISATNAIVILIILLLSVFVASYLLLPKLLWWLLFAYLFLNLLYSFFLKHLVIIDIFAIAIFFEIRLFYGGFAADITISHWLVLTTFFLASLIALGKRRDDVILQETNGMNTRTSVKHYNQIFLDTMVIITSSLLVFIYIVYSVSDWVLSNFGEYFYLSDLFVIVGLSKYLHIIFVDKQSGNPIKILMKDRFILICVILWALSIFYFIYYA